MKGEFVAHVKKKDDGTWASPHLLLEHLDETARIAEIFAAKFSSGAWGRAVGLAHDVGKGRQAWQRYIQLRSGYLDHEAHLENKAGKMPHAIYGAKLVEELFGKILGRLLSYSIAGHHAGLPDWSSAEGAGQSSLQFQQSQLKDLNDVDLMFKNNLQSADPKLPPWKFDRGLDLSLWIRMIYSCLVDADFLDTESYMNSERSDNRGDYCSIPELLERFEQFIKKLEDGSDDTPVNEIRRNIRSKCVQMAIEPQGIFSLSVPTGGGKTLSSVAFGLKHALCHGLDRIIYVIPYTSIIEQNADVLRSAIGEAQIVEHHSSLDEDGITIKSRLASENWDAPVIVTTTVQFFESLFMAKSSRCRKLHNIARSVVILDEAQLIPVEYLRPILETMQLLVDRYRVSFVISTATQPAFGARFIDGKQFAGLKKITEIMGNNPQALFDSLKRVNVQLPEDTNSVDTWEKIAGELVEHEQVLCIVSDRKSCRELFDFMPKGTFHLSALMCGQHRSEVINKINQKLKNKETLRVISTQLVEAGVDFDFPVVYRALAGLDSIAQAAGRCNREGKLSELGKVIVFNAPRKAPLGILRKAADTTYSMISTNPHDPLNYNLFEKFFAELYWRANSLDTKGIIPLLSPETSECSIFFRTAADKFRIIDDSLQKTVLVRYGEGSDLIELLKSRGPERRLMRKLQRFTVNVYNDELEQMHRRGTVAEVQPNIYAIIADDYYSVDIGLIFGDT